MDSSELSAIEKKARIRYEWARARRAVLGFAPSVAIIAVATWLGTNPTWTLAFGAVLFLWGALLLWYGRDVRRAVLPSVLAGVIPLAASLCAKHWGHVCAGEACMTLCLPACVAGGLIAGLVLAAIGKRRQHGIAFWLSASGITLLTGALGCACVGYAGLIGLSAGYAIGVVPALLKSRWPRATA